MPSGDARRGEGDESLRRPFVVSSILVDCPVWHQDPPGRACITVGITDINRACLLYFSANPSTEREICMRSSTQSTTYPQEQSRMLQCCMCMCTRYLQQKRSLSCPPTSKHVPSNERLSLRCNPLYAENIFRCCAASFCTRSRFLPSGKAAALTHRVLCRRPLIRPSQGTRFCWLQAW